MTKIYDALRRFDEQAGQQPAGQNMPAPPQVQAPAPATQFAPAIPPSPAAAGWVPLAPCHSLAVDWMIELRRKLRLGVVGGTETSMSVVQVAAARPGEGVSTVAQNLAAVAAEHAGDRVLLINAPLAATAHGVPDLLQAFTLNGSPDAGLRPSGRVNLSLGWLGQAHLNERVGEPHALFAALRQSFDLIVIDSGSVDRWVNEPVLCKTADGLLLVVRAEHTRWPEVEQTLQTLETIGARVSGLVLNQRRTYIPEFLSRFH